MIVVRPAAKRGVLLQRGKKRETILGDFLIAKVAEITIINHFIFLLLCSFASSLAIYIAYRPAAQLCESCWHYLSPAPDIH